MMDLIFLSVAFMGSALASFFDLRTTEIPDEIPYAMMALGIVGHSIESFLAWSYWPLLSSFLVGLSFLGFGFLLYFLGQWGGGDAKLLSAIGFLVPATPSTMEKSLFFPFPLSFLFNLFLVGSVYMILYAFIVSFFNKSIWSVFLKDLRANARMLLIPILLIPASIFLFKVILIPFSDFPSMFSLALGMVLASMGLFFLWKFVKVVEDVGFKKRIPVSELKVGDVPLDYRVWEGITEEELERIKKSGRKYVWIKEGVRFAPAFPLALTFTLFFGDGILLLMNLHV